MRKNLPIINLVLILAVVVNLWLLRDDPVPPPAAKQVVKPYPAPPSVQKSAAQTKQEAPKIVPTSTPKPTKVKRVSASAPKKKTTPKAPTAPKISLHGVVLLNGTRIAILDGVHSTATASSSTKRKSYRIGDAVGKYQIREIDRNSVTLADAQGKPLKIKMAKRSTP